jgi:hypothetical protein
MLSQHLEIFDTELAGAMADDSTAALPPFLLPKHCPSQAIDGLAMSRHLAVKQANRNLSENGIRRVAQIKSALAHVGACAPWAPVVVGMQSTYTSFGGAPAGVGFLCKWTVTLRVGRLQKPHQARRKPVLLCPDWTSTNSFTRSLLV